MLIFFSIVRDRAEKNNQEDCATEREPSVVDKAKKSIKSFLQYKTSKGKEWNSKWNEKERILKMKRGKKVGIRISSTATAAVLREKAEEKWKAYYSNLYDADEHYSLVYEDGQIVKFLPGTNEPFSLKRYQEESGIDYNRINLYLCTMKDHNDNTRLNVDDFETQIINDALITDKDCIKELNKRVDATGQFFIVAQFMAT